MTERAREHTLLDDLLASSDPHNSSSSHPAAPQHTPTTGPMLTQRDELSLLREAHEIGTPTLAPDGRTSAAFEPHAAPSAESFASEFKTLVQRYPLQSVLVAGGLGYVLTRRRH